LAESTAFGSGDAEEFSLVCTPMHTTFSPDTKSNDGPEREISVGTIKSQDSRFKRRQTGVSYELKLSVWDGSIFFGLPGLTSADNVLLALALLVNSCLQTALRAIVLHLGNSNKQFTADKLRGLELWRDRMEETEIQAVCNRDFQLSSSYLQLSIREDVEDYLAEMSPNLRCGPVLGRVVVLLWTASIVYLVRDLGDNFVALAQLTVIPRASPTQRSRCA